MTDSMAEDERLRRHPTTSDVARLAGVSRGTVSYALNGDPDSKLLDSTKQKVWDAAAKLNYRPSAAARLLSGGRSRSILFFSWSEEEFINPLMLHYTELLARELASLGLGLFWQPGFTGVPRPANELSPALVLCSLRQDDPQFQQLQAEFKVPIVDAFPGIDEFLASAGYEQVDFMLDHGYRRLMYVRAENPSVARIADLRFRSASSHPAVDDLPSLSWPADREAGRETLTRLLASEGPGLGLCAFNDEVALQILGVAYDLGLRVPQDVAVIGVDDLEAGRYSAPALTSVSSDLSDFIPAFAQSLFERARGAEIDSPTIPTHRRVVERSSV